VQDEASQTYVKRVDSITTDDLLGAFEELRSRAGESFAADGIAVEDQEANYQADIRYSGQAFQLSLNVTADELKSKGLAVLTDEFDRQHEQLFTFAHGKDHEIVMIRAIVRAKSSLTADLKEVHDGPTDLEAAKIHDTRFYYEQAWHDAPIYDRGKLGVGGEVTGPAIIQEMDSTTLVLPGHAATVDKVGNLLINPV
jgi:N-methylhydantoinase A